MTGPRLVIELGVEARPSVRQEAMNEAEERRLEFWVKSQPAILKLLVDALALTTRKAA